LRHTNSGNVLWGGSGFHFRLDVLEQLSHFLCPGLLVLVGDELQFTEMMCVAERMLTLLKVQVGFSMVVNGIALELGQDLSRLHANLSPLAIYMVMGEMVCAGHVQPVQLAWHPQTALIKLGDISPHDFLLDPFQTGLGLCHPLLVGGDDDRFRFLSREFAIQRL
jgi:hypothetical protein